MSFDKAEEGVVVAAIATRDIVRRELCKYYSWMFAGAPHNGGSEVREKVAELELKLFNLMKKELR